MSFSLASFPSLFLSNEGIIINSIIQSTATKEAKDYGERLERSTEG